MAAGSATREAAVEAALIECRKKRFRMRMQAECTLYAIDSERTKVDR